MKWIKPSQATLDYFERLAPGAPLETRRMFGLPCRFLNGYVLVGIFGDALMLHLSKDDRAKCIADGAQPFQPLGREMKGYVSIAPGTFEDHDLKWWIVRGMRYLASLPPLVQKPKARKLKAKAGGKARPKATPKPKAPRAKLARKPTSKKAARKAASKPTRKAPKPRPAAPKKKPAPKKRRVRR